jgi:hypothetical protein
MPSSVNGHDADHPELDAWYKSLRLEYQAPYMTDGSLSHASCCGTADAYWCDQLGREYDANGEPQVYCQITDDREVVGRPQIPLGTKFFIPPEKYNVVRDLGISGGYSKDIGNPTGHHIIFIGADGQSVYCFVAGTLG